ncbi:hypothetical protein NGH39_13250, partial [Staphylococcus pasteuri]
SNTVSAEAGVIKLKRHADNYSLRPNNTPQQVFVELDRKVYDFSLKHDADFGKFHNTAAVSYRNDSQNGERNTHTAMCDFLNGYLSPMCTSTAGALPIPYLTSLTTDTNWAWA